MSNPLEAPDLTPPPRPRLELVFSESDSEPEQALAPEVDEPSNVIALPLPATSELASSTGEPAADPEFKAAVKAAIDRDIEAWIVVATKSPSTRLRDAGRLFVDWGDRSEDFKRELAAHLVGATLDPRTWRTARHDVGPRPHVGVRLSFPLGRWTMPPEIDVVLIYRTQTPAGTGLNRLADAMTPEVAVPSPAIVLQARRNAAARAALLTEFGALTASQVAELSGSEARNRSALAGRWRREGRLVAVEHHGAVYYPAFQFDEDGRPRRVVERILSYLDNPHTSPWQQALWFTTANGWLDGRRPVDLIGSEPEAVVAAARDAFREPVG